MDKSKQQLAADLTRQEPGKVGLKGILKASDGGTPARGGHGPAMGGFNLRPFRVDGRSSTPEDEALHHEISSLQAKLHAARAQIEQVRIQMDTRVAEAFDKGKAEGYAEGEKTGKAQATKIYQDALQNIRQQIEQTVNTISTEQVRRWDELRDACVELVIAAMKRLHCEQAVRDKELIPRVVTEALSHLGREEQLIIRVHPLDGPLLEEARSLWIPASGFARELRLEVDERIARGGCQVESESGIIDLSAQSMMSRMEAIVRGAYASSQP